MNITVLSSPAQTFSSGPLDVAEGREALNANPTLEDADKDGIPDQWAISPPANGSATKMVTGCKKSLNNSTSTT